MDIIEQVKKFVAKKVEKVIHKDLEEKIVEENSTFDAELYVNYLLDKYFDREDIENLKEILNNSSYSDFLYIDSENSSEDRNSINDSLELEANEYQMYSTCEIINNLQNDSEEVQKKYLKVLESTAEDLVIQSEWNKITEILQEMLNKTGSREIQNLALKVFEKPLRCPKKPQIVSKGFTSIAEMLTNQIYNFNFGKSFSLEEIYDIRQNKWLPGKTNNSSRSKKTGSPEVMIKSMWLLIECQHQVPSKWVGFNEARFREIIYCFIRLLSSTTLENKDLSGLEILSVLNPSADWCRYWCHTAVGRNLLTSALRKYRSFFIQIVEIILRHIKSKRGVPARDGANLNKKSQNFRGGISEKSTPNKNTNIQVEEEEIERPTSEESSKSGKVSNIKESPEWIVESIPRTIVNEAVFFHSISFVSCLIQFRSGRALFPVQTVTKKRLLTIQDLSLSIIEYLENIQWQNDGIPFTSNYEVKVMEILKILKDVKTQINSSRLSTDNKQFYEKKTTKYCNN